MSSQVLKRLFSYIKNYKGKFTIAIIATFLGTAFTVFAPRLLGDVTTILYDGIIDHLWFVEELPDGTINPDSVYVQGPFIPVGKAHAIMWIIIVLLVMYALSFLFSTTANRLMARIASCVIKDLRNDIDTKMHKLQLNYYDTRTNGEILSVITNDVDAINTLLGKNLYQCISGVITLVGVLVMLVTVNGWLALIALLMVPGTLLLSGPVMKRGAQSFAAQQNLLGAVNGYVQEMFDGQNVVASFNYQDDAIEQFEAINEELRAKAESAERYSGTIMPLTQMANNIGYAVSGLVGCLLALTGAMTVGGIQSALQYTKTFQQPFTTFAQMSSQVSSAIAAGARIFDLLDAEEEVPDPEPGTIPTDCAGTVEFKNVQFGYTPDHLLMTDVSFEAKSGQKIAIVGPTGAGKTTLINLLMRFYEISGGQIVVDGVNTKEMTRNELRNHFGMVLQDTWLFEGTIRDNLKYSTTREVSDEEMEAATKSVCADTFIHTMPGGYDMVLSKGAENISQGQRQLLTIARAIIADPEIMILDEATSNVDAHTEQAIQDAMAVLLKGRTSFVIAHRLSTIRDANVILYMENGDIKEVGDHETLMKLNGKYTALYNSQFG
jgi:ATP-binding cassette subfamily B protein